MPFAPEQPNDPIQFYPRMRGQHIAHYQIESKLGSGGMGEVYLALDTTLDRQVALKLLPAAFADDPQRAQRLALEAKAASAINHPNVCTIYGFGTTPDHQAYLVMEYVAGTPLEELTQSRPCTASETAKLGLQIAAALAAAHAKGIVHRDIKPANIKVNELGLIKVLDFGLAKWSTDAPTLPQKTSKGGTTQPGIVAGTPSYMSPEQALGNSIDVRSDLFSLGILLYELLYGMHPFKGKNVAETIHNIVNVDPFASTTHTPSSDFQLISIIQRCLRKKPVERFPSGGELMDALQNLVVDATWAFRMAPPADDQTTELETQLFSSSIREHLLRVKREVEKLTQDQLRILQYLRMLRRVRIAGCAGSGKTLIAAEKTIRLAKAGVRTLFLCHSPLLANHVREMTRGSGAHVLAFQDWVQDLVGSTPNPTTETWSNYAEPDAATLDKAFDQIVSQSIRFDAVVIDEGQDFREVWWTLIEATQPNGNGILYIFHDDRQALLPYRSVYPIDEPVMDLSRNCRNAGRIYELIKHFDESAPTTESALAGKGTLRLTTFQPGDEQPAIEHALRWASQGGFLDRSAFLLGGSERVASSPFRDFSCAIPTTTPWQDEIHRQFERIRAAWRQPRGARPIPKPNSIADQLAHLSAEFTPTADDIAVVQKLAKSFIIDTALAGTHSDFSTTRTRNHWIVRQGELSLKQARLPEIVETLQRDDWASGIPAPTHCRLKEGSQLPATSNEQMIPLYDIATYKGLESDCIILTLRGNDPQLARQIYVGISRARFALYILADASSSNHFPRSLLNESAR